MTLLRNHNKYEQTVVMTMRNRCTL